MRKRHALQVLTAASATAIGVLAPTSSAFAARDATAYTASVGVAYAYKAGTFTFKSKGEIFTVCDNDADGAGVYGYMESGDNINLVVEEKTGAGHCNPWNASLPEGQDFKVLVCLEDGGTIITASCSDATAEA